MFWVASSASETRFERKRQAIVDAATMLINRNGVKGLTFVEVAEIVGIGASSIAYYFRRKELLAAACYTGTLDRIEAIVTAALHRATVQARVGAYLDGYIALHAAIRAGDAPPLAILSDMRALDEEVRAPLMEHYSRIFAQVRAFFGVVETEHDRVSHGARALILTEAIYWFPVTLDAYFVEDFARVRTTMIDIFLHGLTPANGLWRSGQVSLGEDAPGGTGGGQDFLRVATRLIGERGYRGASVEKIAAELNVTKGSFYHHNAAKDDVVLACFRRSYAVMAAAQRQADALSGNWLDRLAVTIESLLRVQMAGEWPLLRTTALQTLPPDVREEVLDLSRRVARHFSGMISDGIVDGSIRPVDPEIAGNIIMSSINAATELRLRDRSGAGLDEAVALYAAALAYGLLPSGAAVPAAI